MDARARAGSALLPEGEGEHQNDVQAREHRQDKQIHERPQLGGLLAEGLHPLHDRREVHEHHE